MEIKGLLRGVHHAVGGELCVFCVGGFNMVSSTVTQGVTSITSDLCRLLLLGRALDSLLWDLLLPSMEVLAALSGGDKIYCFSSDKLDVLCFVLGSCCVLFVVLVESSQVYVWVDDVLWGVWSSFSSVYGDELGGV